MFDTYSVSLWGVFVIVATLVLQMMIASVSKAKQPGAVPGRIDPGLSHASCVFRSNPSPRSYFFLIGFGANIALLFVVVAALL